MIVVLVLIISCQVSENPKMGPLTLHSNNAPSAATNIHGRPNHAETVVVNFVKKSFFNLLIFFSINHLAYTLDDDQKHPCYTLG